MVSAGSMAISRSSPSIAAAIRILRTKGDDGEWRSVSMKKYGDRWPRPASESDGDQRTNGTAARALAGDDEIDRLRTLALLVGLDVQGDALSLGQRFEPGPLDRGDVHEHVAAAVVRLDEAVAALRI